MLDPCMVLHCVPTASSFTITKPLPPSPQAIAPEERAGEESSPEQKQRGRAGSFTETRGKWSDCATQHEARVEVQWLAATRSHWSLEKEILAQRIWESPIKM